MPRRPRPPTRSEPLLERLEPWEAQHVLRELGLYALREDDAHDLLAYAPDFPVTTAAEALVAWRRTPRKATRETSGRGRPEFPAAFVREYLPNWKTLVDRELRRK